jgi:hypothetical protein
MSLPPTGAQVVLRHGEAEVTVVEVGGGLRTYRCGDRDVLDGHRVGEMALLRAGWRVGDLVVDHCSTDLERDPDGPARVRFTGPDGGGAVVRLDEGHPYLSCSPGTCCPSRAGAAGRRSSR